MRVGLRAPAKHQAERRCSEGQSQLASRNFWSPERSRMPCPPFRLVTCRQWFTCGPLMPKQSGQPHGATLSERHRNWHLVTYDARQLGARLCPPPVGNNVAHRDCKPGKTLADRVWPTARARRQAPGWSEPHQPYLHLTEHQPVSAGRRTRSRSTGS